MRILTALFLIFSPLVHAIKDGTVISGALGPYQSAVQILTVEDAHYRFLCSGTLIAPDVVLTDSNCVRDQANHKIIEHLVISNKSHLDQKVPAAQNLQAILASVQDHEHHPSQKVTLLFLHQAIAQQPAIILSKDEDNQLNYMDTVTIVGFGKNAPIRKESRWAFSGNATSDSMVIARTATGQIQSRTALELSFASKNPAIAVCSGDEGGPLFGEVNSLSDNYQRLLGILSHTRFLETCQADARILSIQPLREFIDRSLRKACQEKRRIWCKEPGILEPEFFDKPPIIQEIEKPDGFCTSPDLLPDTKEPGPELRTEKEYVTFERANDEQNGDKGHPIHIENLGCRCTKTTRRR